ncbi:hypothetical protein [Burkholderia seminalis]|uniref:hypothetical protein n=1 Tax=Burkholderia seminalis TaxID=488731 RepID=UPI001CF24C14|nr:hypothetical protein [Burkholderia seminalis]
MRFDEGLKKPARIEALAGFLFVRRGHSSEAAVSGTDVEDVAAGGVSKDTRPMPSPETRPFAWLVSDDECAIFRQGTGACFDTACR